MTQLEQVIKALKETKLEDISVYDLEMSSPFFDYFIVGTAHNKRELNSIVSKIWEENIEYNHIEGTDESGWILIDMGSIILNIMTEEARSLYNLDSLYIKYKKINIE